MTSCFFTGALLSVVLAVFVPKLAAFAEEPLPHVAKTDERTSQVFRESTPPELLEDIAEFTRYRGLAADEARSRIVARGSAQVPEILAALDDAVSNGGTNAQIFHLMFTFAALADATHALEFVNIAKKMDPDVLVAGSTFEVLDRINSSATADELALEVLKNGRGMLLLRALSRYWHQAPANIAEFALPHTRAEMSLVRAAAYRVTFVGGLGEEIRDQLIDDVSNAKHLEPGNITLMNVLAAMEPEAEFKSRLEDLSSLHRSTKNAALLMNRFVWQGPDGKIALLQEMLDSDNSELRSTAIAYILETGRSDLLSHYHLAFVYSNTLAELESQDAKDKILIIKPLTRIATKGLGYRLSVADDGESVEIHRD